MRGEKEESGAPMTQTKASHEVAQGNPEPRPTSLQLFWNFLTLGLTGFGGVLPIARRMIVEKRKWLHDDEFIEVLGLCQFVPGGNILNVAVVLGMKFRGLPGALAALVGILVAPTAIAIALAGVYAEFIHEAWVRRAVTGLAAAAAGLLASLAIKVAWPMRRNRTAMIFALVCFGAIALARAPLALVVLCLTPICVVVLDRGAR
jgi:chromate transporter